MSNIGDLLILISNCKGKTVSFFFKNPRSWCCLNCFVNNFQIIFKVVFSSKETCQWFISSGREAVSSVIESASKVQVILIL